jgi:hypothetical protein
VRGVAYEVARNEPAFGELITKEQFGIHAPSVKIGDNDAWPAVSPGKMRDEAAAFHPKPTLAV